MGTFAKSTEAKYENGAIRFIWHDKNKNEARVYTISADLLLQSFGARSADGKELLDAFERGKDQIALAVERSLNLPTDGVTELGSGDFDPKAARRRVSPP